MNEIPVNTVIVEKGVVKVSKHEIPDSNFDMQSNFMRMSAFEGMIKKLHDDAVVVPDFRYRLTIYHLLREHSIDKISLKEGIKDGVYDISDRNLVYTVKKMKTNEVIDKTPCECSCHKNRAHLHIMACCDNGFINQYEIIDVAVVSFHPQSIESKNTLNL